MSEVLEDNSVKESLINITTDLASDDFSRYLIDRMHQLEQRNLFLKEQQLKTEAEKRKANSQKLKFERELRQLRSEMERLKAAPLIVGTIVDVLENDKLIVRSSTGPQFIVGLSKFIKESELEPGTQVAMNQQTLAVISILPPSKSRLIREVELVKSPDVDYSQIGGLKEQIREIREAVELPLSNPEAFVRIGIDPPKGVLLYGPPGTGKTMLAKAVAKHTDTCFIRLVGSELVKKYIGEGARMVRELFKLAIDNAPSIIFIDELDSIAAKRYDGATAGDREVQRTLMQLLAEMDGFNPRGEVRLLAATNRLDILDPAILRPGRFDRFIEVKLPDADARESIMMIHSRNMTLSKNIVFKYLAKITDGSSGSDLKAIVTEAGMFAIRNERECVEVEDMENAVTKVLNHRKNSNQIVENMFQ
ncbi:MAG: Proteasome-activating nucleotidase [ANME-2 cluster archaeon HR1]|jgi:proteasome regulatory subunit|nr:MAG: proteasome regulatory subunit [ANME-2 cluster archaeon]KAF5426464.1 proteasome regulatory subunit [ANME-2 cluster archaeon]PPA80489.1 MAG: Proteasome-activating nucleotidase [ANME-2 cluster archaeon HR1]